MKAMGVSGESDVPTTVEQLLDLERRIGDEAQALSTLAGSQPVVAGVLEGLRTTADEHRKALEAARTRVSAIAPPLTDLRITQALFALYSLLNEAVLAYAALHALAHRAFDSQSEGNTANLAESHLRAYTRAIQELDPIIADAVVLESSEHGVECHCACPACGLGLCLCSPHGTNTLRQAWRETLPPPAGGGLRVRPPRSGSEARRAELRAGDRVVAIDGTAIADDLDIGTIQAAIRAHSSGGEIRLAARRDEDAPREITLHHP